MQPPPNHVAMMQIDCEVMNTRLLHIKEDAIPLHMMAAHHMMNNHSNNGKHQENRSGTENNQRYNSYNSNASINQINKRRNDQRMVNIVSNESKHDDIHSYYRGGYNLSYFNARNIGNINNESVVTETDISSLQFNEEESELPNETFAYNDMKDIDGTAMHGTILNERDGKAPNLILQRSPGIVPRRFNRNAKVRDTGSIDNGNGNHSSSQKIQHKKLEQDSTLVP